MIGKDFPKIEFDFLGLHLLEPLGGGIDLLLAIISFILFFRLKNKQQQNTFFKSWELFYLFFGFSVFFGAIGHWFYNYFGVIGLTISWIHVPIALFFAQKSVLSIHWSNKIKKQFFIFIFIKMISVYLVFITLFFIVPFQTNPSLLFIPIAIDTIISLLFLVGGFSFHYTQKTNLKLKWILRGIFILLPSSFIFLFKINLHPWFTKNDFAHTLMIITLFCFYLELRKLVNLKTKLPVEKTNEKQ